MLIDLVPVEIQILVYQDVPKSSHRSELLGKILGQNARFPQPKDGFVRISRLLHLLNGNDSIRSVNAGLRRYFQVPLYDILQIGILEELSFLLFLKGFEFEQAFFESFQAPLDTAEFRLHSPAPFLGSARPAGDAGSAGSRNSG